MRCEMLCCAVVALFVLGCRQQAAPPAAMDRSDASGASQTEPYHARVAEGADAAASLEATADGAQREVQLDAIALTAPAGWERKPASSSFVAAEFALPRAEGDEADGRLTISTAGGSVEANIDRWQGQFEPQPEEASQEEFDITGLKVTIVDFSGEFNDQRGPFAPGVRRPNYRMIGAVIPINGQLHFIKATGPQKTIASHAESIHQFIRSVRPRN